MNKQEQIAFLENVIDTLTKMRQEVLDMMAENEARLVEINAHIDRFSNANPETIVRYKQ
jgi:cell division septum initiation protein DivIVA